MVCYEPRFTGYYLLLITAPSTPLNIVVLPINATAVRVMWDEPAIPNGIIQYYDIIILSNPVVILNHTNLVNLTLDIYGLTHNTNYTINISAVTVEPGDAASMSFTTPSCKCVIVLMCYLMYCFD